MPKPTLKKRKQLIQGRDYHGWAWKFPWKGRNDVLPIRGALCYFAMVDKPRMPPKTLDACAPGGKWVRVKFIEVE